MRAAIVAALLLTGCATTERLVEIRIPTPIACQVAEPARPMMDTDTIPLDSPIDTMARAMRAEIERREGYETQLRTALQSCKAIGNP
jgi:PBP1b-binding outer membrane lipoprotein LpoB